MKIVLKNKAFTLAEVLITLTILGVVAAIMVPSLMKQNYNRTQVSRMAKAYATLQDAVQNIAASTGCIGKNIACTGLTNISDDNERNSKFVQLSKLRVIKGRESGYRLRARYLYCEKKECGGNTGNTYVVFRTTPDNIAYSIEVTNIILNPEKGAASKREPALSVRVFTDSDLQDTKRNIIGRNVFKFIIHGNFEVEPLVTGFGGSVTPLSKARGGWETKNDVYTYCDSSDNATTAVGSGSTCAARIILDGWKMKY